MYKKFSKRSFSISDTIMNVIILICACVNLFPFYWLFSNSFKLSNSIVKMPPQWFLFQPTMINYERIFQSGEAWIWMGNSVLIAGGTTAGVVVVSCLAAYAFAKLRFPGRDVLFLIFISTLMLPKEVFIVPLFKIMTYLNMNGTYTGILLPNLALPFGVFLLKQFFTDIPDSLRESARIDGANELRIFWSIILPISKPGISALSILVFVQTWNDFLWQLVMVSKNEMRTIQLAIASMQSADQVDYGLRYAGACLCAIPMLLIFLIFQKYFTRGLTMGAVKE